MIFEKYNFLKSLLNLFNKLHPMRHNQHITSPVNVKVKVNVKVTLKVFPYDLSEYHGLSRPCRHLHHHAPMSCKRLPHALTYLNLIVSQHIYVNVFSKASRSHWERGRLARGWRKGTLIF